MSTTTATRARSAAGLRLCSPLWLALIIGGVVTILTVLFLIAAGYAA